jgi:hypothetical protein
MQRLASNPNRCLAFRLEAFECCALTDFPSKFPGCRNQRGRPPFAVKHGDVWLHGSICFVGGRPNAWSRLNSPQPTQPNRLFWSSRGTGPNWPIESRQWTAKSIHVTETPEPDAGQNAGQSNPAAGCCRKLLAHSLRRSARLFAESCKLRSSKAQGGQSKWAVVIRSFSIRMMSSNLSVFHFLQSTTAQGGFDAKHHHDIGCGRARLGIDGVLGQRPNAGARSREHPGARADRHPDPQGRLSRLGPLVPARPASGLRSGALLVRSLLVSSAEA